jgi:hypothetical protein
MNDDATLSTDTARLRLTLDVSYRLNGESPGAMAGFLRRCVDFALANGLLTGESAAEVADCACDVSVTPPAPPAAGLDVLEAEIAAFMRQRMMDGDLPAEDIPLRLARYGLMAPGDFIDEIGERREMAQDD